MCLRFLLILKHTTLSWAAKWEMDKYIQTLLGHHSTGGKSLDTYAMCWHRHCLSKALRQVRTGSFAPDVSTSGFMNPPAQTSTCEGQYAGDLGAKSPECLQRLTLEKMPVKVRWVLEDDLWPRETRESAALEPLMTWSQVIRQMGKPLQVLCISRALMKGVMSPPSSFSSDSGE